MLTVIEVRTHQAIQDFLPAIAKHLEGIDHSLKVIADHMTEDTMPSDPKQPEPCKEELPF